MNIPLSTLTRREFGFTLSGWAVAARLFGAESTAPWMQPATVRKVFLAVKTPSWPRPDLDVAAEKTMVDQQILDAARRNPDTVKFTGGELIRSAEDAEALVRNLGDEDAILIADLTSGTGPLLKPFRDVNKPLLLYSRPYSGWSYTEVAQWAQSGKKADLISSSDPGELDPYFGMFRTIHHLRTSKILVLSPAMGSAMADGFTKHFGTAFAFPGFGPLKDAYHSADAARAEKEAGAFVRGALKVVEPSAQEVADSFRLYRAIMNMLESERANAIAIDCLGGFRRADLPAYPCIAFTLLNDAGMYGVCEADIPSTMTQLLVTSLTRKPGFVSDPVFDTARNEIIHAHCVSATRLKGLDGPMSPYVVRSHMEDNKGVSLQVIVPVNETVTVAKFLKPDVFGVSLGHVTENIDEARGCRTKFRTKVADARKMLEGYTGGLHRVVFYGDYLKPVQRMGRLMGFKVIQET